MKIKHFLLGFLMLVSFAATAQEDENQRTIFGPKDGSKADWGFECTVYGGVSQLKDMCAGEFSFDFGAIRNHNFVFGGFIEGLGTEEFSDPVLGNEKFGFLSCAGGIYFKPIFMSSSPVHFSLPIKIGGGSVEYTNGVWSGDYYDGYDHNYYHYNDRYYREDHSGFFLFQPGLNIDFNLFKHFHISAGVSYRMMVGMNLDYRNSRMYNDDYYHDALFTNDKEIISTDGLNGLTYTLGLTFGMF
jgi:hypothetical protein